jgi:hypothetical protein
MIRERRIVGKCAPRTECEPNLLHPAIVAVCVEGSENMNHSPNESREEWRVSFIVLLLT